MSEARRVCPEVIIVLGEDLTRFRDASKELHKFLVGSVWIDRCERLGFDEAWLDCTDMVDYNMELLNPYDLESSFFQLDRNDPSSGFAFDASATLGYTFPPANDCYQDIGTDLYSLSRGTDSLGTRLRLASHLANFLRTKLEQEKGYTATVGISTNKLLSKLVGNRHKPNAQTTLLPPYNTGPEEENSSVTDFLDPHDIGKIPGIGFKISQRLREYVLGRTPAFQNGLAYEPSKESVSVEDVRKRPNMGPGVLDNILGGPGSPKDIGRKIFELIHGKDDSDVGIARPVPTQISIEDSYPNLDTLEEVHKEMLKLSKSLLKRMRLDLVDFEPDDRSFSSRNFASQAYRVFNDSTYDTAKLSWLAIPRTIRLTTRPRPPLNNDGSRPRSFNRISRSGPLPPYVLTSEPIDRLALSKLPYLTHVAISFRLYFKGLVQDDLLPLFRKLHPTKSGWNLSLLNLAVTQIDLMAGNSRAAQGRDISHMLRGGSFAANGLLQQHAVAASTNLAQDAQHLPPGHPWSSSARVEDKAVGVTGCGQGSEDWPPSTQETMQSEPEWDDGNEVVSENNICLQCGARMPDFALDAHVRFHLNSD